MKNIDLSRNKKTLNFFVGLFLLALFVGSSGLLVKNTERIKKTDFLLDIEQISQSINEREIFLLTGSQEDKNSENYLRLKNQFQLTKTVYPNIHAFSLIGRSFDEKLVSYLDIKSQPSSGKDMSVDFPNQITAEIDEVFDLQESKVVGPFNYDEGRWVSALVPIFNHSTGRVELIFKAEVDADEWKREITNEVVFPIIVFFILFVFLFISFQFSINKFKHSSSKFMMKITPIREVVFFLVLGVLVTTIFSWYRFQISSLEKKESFSQLAGARSGYINTYIQNLNNIYLEGIKNFFKGSEYVDQQEFAQYTSTLSGDANVLAWAWMPEIKNDEVESFKERMTTMGVKDYQLWEMDENERKVDVNERSTYYPIAYIYPMEGNEISYGFDHGSNQIRLETILAAKKTNLIQATNPVKILQTIYGDTGILIYNHVHYKLENEQRDGYVQAIINTNNLLKVALGNQTENNQLLYLDLFQIGEKDYPILLASNSPREITESHIQSFFSDHPFSELVLVKPIFAFGKVYAMVVHPGPAYTSKLPASPGWSTIIFGVIITLLTGTIVYSFTSRRSSLEKMVLARTDELSKSEQKYKNLAESTNAVFWEYDILQDRWTYVAPQITKIMGWSPKDFTNLQFWTDHIHPNDREWARDYCADFTKLGENHEFEYRFTKPDGSYLWVREVVTVEMKKDVPVMLRGYMLDVTQKKEDEETQLIHSIALKESINSILITDKNGFITWVNPSFESLTGNNHEEVIGKRPGEILKSGVHDRNFYRKMWETILSGTAWRGELINRKKDGTLYHQEMSITPVKDQSGKITNFVAIQQDISERKRHEFELEALEKVNSTIRLTKTNADMISNVLDLVMQLFRAEGSALVLYDQSSNRFQLEAAKGVFEGNLHKNLGEGESISGIVKQSGKPFITNDITREEGIIWSQAYEITTSIACVPLFVEGMSIGNLRIGRSSAITHSDLRLLLSIGDILANGIHREILREETAKQLDRLSTLRSIDKVLTSIVDQSVVLNFIIEQVATRLEIDAIAIHLYNPISHRVQYVDGRGFLTTEIQKTNVMIGEYNVGRVALNKETLRKPSVTVEDFPGGNLIQREKFVSYFATPIIAKGQIKGVMEVFNRNHMTPDEEWINYLETLAGQTAIAIDNSQMFEGLQRSNFELSMAYEATIEGWSKAMDLRDKETEGHTQRVTEMTIKLAQMAGMDEDEMIHIRRGSLLHDMGKLGIPDRILHKPGALDPEEWELMKKHTIFAYEMLAPIDYLKKAIDIPYCHHERWDGSGYPRGLSGEQIPMAARIFAVVDVYDALTSDRPYRPAWTKQKTLDYIVENKFKQFDPKVVDLFLKFIAFEK